MARVRVKVRVRVRIRGVVMTTERWCDDADHAHAAQGAAPLTWCAESRRGVGLELE